MYIKRRIFRVAIFGIKNQFDKKGKKHDTFYSKLLSLSVIIFYYTENIGYFVLTYFKLFSYMLFISGRVNELIGMRMSIILCGIVRRLQRQVNLR